MQKLIRLAIAGAVDDGTQAAFDELRRAVHRAGGVELAPLFVPTYAALYETMAAGLAQLAWAPPLVARDLERGQIAHPIAAAMRFDETIYYSAIVVLASSPIVHVGDLETARTHIGWVSKLSAAGYVVPRAFLRAQGLEPSRVFASESLWGTHTSVLAALVEGEIDVAATYAAVRGNATMTAETKVPTRLLATAGPIPGDVIVVGDDVEAGHAEAIAAAFARASLAADGPVRKLMNVARFTLASPDHLMPLARWADRASDVAPPLLPDGTPSSSPPRWRGVRF